MPLRALKALCSLAVHLGAAVASSFSITSVASRRYLTSLLSLSGTPQVRKCVAWTAARTACPSEPRASFTSPSILACSLEKRPVRSHWDNTFSCATEACLQKSFAMLSELPSGSLCGKLVNCTAYLCDCRFSRGPTVGELPGSVGEVLKRAIQFVQQTILILLGPFELVSRFCDYCTQHISLFVL